MTPEPAKTTTYTSLEEKATILAPTIKFSRIAIKWLMAMADMHEHEVGVFGFVDELPDNTYLVRDIFFPKHSEAAGATCEISPEGETMMAEWLLAHDRENDIPKVRFWGHSHVNMGVSPSGQDEDQSIERMNRNQSYIIRGIFNKSGLMSISFYDYQNKRRFDNINWKTDEDPETKTIREKIQELKATNLPVTKGYTPSVRYDGYEDADGWSDARKDSRFNNFPSKGLPEHNNFGIGFGGGNVHSFKSGKRNRKKHKRQYSFEFQK